MATRDTSELIIIEVLTDFPVSVVSGFVKIKIHAAQMIVSPAYDRGVTAEELRVANLAKLNAL